MEAIEKGRYLRHDPDDDLRAIGVNIIDRTKETSVAAENRAEVEADYESGIPWGDLKLPALFLALVIGIGICENMGLMAEVIAVPGMCVCAACFGWNVKK